MRDHVERQPQDGIRYGYISANSLNADLVYELLYGCHATDHSYEQAKADLRERLGFEWDDALAEAEIAASEVDHHMSEASHQAFLDNYMEEKLGCTEFEDYFDRALDTEEFHCEEPEISGVYEGVHYRTSYLGGALNFFVFEGPVGRVRSLCSPCVPGAGDLDSGFTFDADSDDYECYCVPLDWLHREG